MSPSHPSKSQRLGATEVTLVHIDCVQGMASLEPESVDVVVTSPPYNLGIAYRTYKDTSGRQEYLDWCATWAAAVQRVLRPEGSFFLNVGAAPSNPFLPHEILLRMRESFVLQNTLHWIKSITIHQRDGSETSAGHFKPLQSPRYLTDCHEYIFHLTRSGRVPVDRLAVGVKYADKSNIARWGHTGGRDRRCRGNSWFIPYRTIRSRDADRPHPATFPVELPEMCIRLHGLRPDLSVMDPFVGIGHSAVAAIRCGAGRFTGFDIDDGYLAEARRRIEEPDAQPNLPALAPPSPSASRPDPSESPLLAL